MEPNPLDELAPRRNRKASDDDHIGGPGGGDDSDERPAIEIVPGELPAIVDAAEAALIDAGADIFQSGGRLVAVAFSDPDGARAQQIRRDDGAPRLITVTPVHLREVLTRVARWERFDARTKMTRGIDCPMPVATALVDRGRWRFHELVGYVEAPAVREDGTPITQPGYDAATGLYLLPGAPRVTLPPDPTRDDAGWAAEALAAAVSSWPYVTTGDHAAAVAMILTALYARSVDASPMCCVTAPQPGTGKSLLVDAASIVATGRRAAVMSLGKDPTEAGKRLAAGLLQGDSPLSADNVETPLGDELLCQAVTQPWLSVRPLGSSTPVRVPARTALVATGNNLQIKGDLVRRVMMIRIDAEMERPETRAFIGDVLAETRARRGELITAALTVTQAYHAAGCPDVAIEPLGGFSDWDRLVRRALVWAGLSDPLEPTAEIRSDDPDRAAMVSLFVALAEVYVERTVAAADIVEDASRGAPRFDGDGYQYDHPALHDAVRQVCGDRVDARKLGAALRRYRGRIADGLRLDGVPRHGPAKVTGWRIVSLSHPCSLS